MSDFRSHAKQRRFERQQPNHFGRAANVDACEMLSGQKLLSTPSNEASMLPR